MLKGNCTGEHRKGIALRELNRTGYVYWSVALLERCHILFLAFVHALLALEHHQMEPVRRG